MTESVIRADHRIGQRIRRERRDGDRESLRLPRHDSRVTSAARQLARRRAHAVVGSPRLVHDVRAEHDGAHRGLDGGHGDDRRRAARGKSRVTAALEVAVVRQIGEFELDVAFTAESGILVLFGPSGAGKSLTLALIAGLIRPDTGTITINGHIVTDCAERIHVSTQDRRIGMVFQDGLLLPHRSVLDNVALAVRQSSGRRARREVARSWLEQVGADELADRRPSSLSGGQRQRVALARGLAGDPALVLLDEPLSALDLTVRRELRELIRRGHRVVWCSGCARDTRCRGSRGSR